MIVTQTLAIFRDAYGELNSKKLFWVVLGLSLVVVAAFAAVGINEKGLTFLHWQIDSPINSLLFPPEMFYKLTFANLGVKWWLGWLATVLALVSTASIIPDFVAGGTIELSLARPIGRLRLFLTKYLTGLLFVALQVAVFTAAAFVVIGVRGKAWEPGLFWSVPLVLCFFSYLFAFSALLGLVTRSTIASLLITLLIWFALFGVHTAEQTFQALRISQQVWVEDLRREAAESAEPNGSPVRSAKLARDQEELKQGENSLRRWALWHSGFYGLKTLLPKTAETIDLLERKLISDADLEELRGRDNSPPVMFGNRQVDTREVTKRIEDERRDRPAWWILGTSLAFEGVVLGLAAWIFCRRDF